jgi:transposase
MELKMMKKPVTTKAPAEQVVKDIRRATRKLHSSEEKIRIVLSGLRGEDSIAELCRTEGIVQSLYYSWSKEFLEAGKKRLAGDTARHGKKSSRSSPSHQQCAKTSTRQMRPLGSMLCMHLSDNN